MPAHDSLTPGCVEALDEAEPSDDARADVERSTEVPIEAKGYANTLTEV